MNTRSTIPENVSLEVQALQKAHHASLNAHGEINVLQLETQEKLFTSTTRSILAKKQILTFDEVALLMDLYPSTIVENNLLISSLSEILTSDKINAYHIAEIMLNKRYNNFCFSIVEKLGLMERFNQKNHEYAPYIISTGEVPNEILNQKEVEDWQARLLLSSIQIFDNWGEPKDLPYVKIFSFLKRSKRYSDATNLHFDTYEFSKFYLIQHMSEELLGVHKLPLNRRKIFTLHPDPYYKASMINASLKEITVAENIAKGEELFLFLAVASQPGIRNLFQQNILKQIQKNDNEHLLLPAFNSMEISTEESFTSTVKFKKNFSLKEELKKDYSKGFLENPNRLKIFVKDSDAPIVEPEFIKITYSSSNERFRDGLETEMLLVGETQLNDIPLNLTIGNPVSVHFNPLHLTFPALKSFKVFVDNLGQASHIHIEVTEAEQQEE